MLNSMVREEIMNILNTSYHTVNYFMNKGIMRDKLILNQTTDCGPLGHMEQQEQVPLMKELEAQLHEENISCPFHPSLGPDDIV